jgi:hypothetical protein
VALAFGMEIVAFFHVIEIFAFDVAVQFDG